ncbi:shikimate kinase [Methanobacterium formicicum]|uniref:Shikimate kinase n=1 Tax=Methanobacterium formicicum (strain DSM 3637 / PP1) TaxID=1204725 RepID=K2R956_METFP|nr:shikimate kinase [Methanobacterium formicicum]EKF84824.1 shikimate kinase [Methanobacterium formicicum DSM 3637]
MKAIVRSPGSATVINAISTGCGSAFGIKLYVTAEASLNSSKRTFKVDRDVDTTLMEICVNNVLEKFNVNTGIHIKTSSTLPMASGLSSSSATSNAVVLATYQALVNDGVVPQDSLNDLDVLNLAIDASLEAGVTITGAFDDASASFMGGLTITHNSRREIFHHGNMEEQNILIYMPNRKSPTAQSDVGRMKLLAPWVKLAFQEALKGNIYEALTLNGMLYSAALGFDAGIALDALNSGALAAGLSGTGPSFVAIVPEENIDPVQEVWSSYPGNVILTQVDNVGTKVVDHG